MHPNDAKTLPMAGAQFKQNHCEIVKSIMCYDTAETVGYSEYGRLSVK